MAASAKEALEQGRLDEAMTLAVEAVRREPAKPAHRVLLFQLYAVQGGWERALRQLSVLSDLDPKLELMASAYRQLIACEAVRTEIMAGKRQPLCLGHPPDWLAPLLEALRLDAEGAHDAAAALRAQAFEAADAVPGTIDGREIAWIADADPRLGPCLEAVIEGRYFWVPFARLQRLVVEPPTDLRDLVWCPVNLTFANEGSAVAFVPTRYPGTELDPDPALRLARATAWRDIGAGTFIGLGQRMLASDLDEHPLLDLRQLVLRPPAEEAPPGDG